MFLYAFILFIIDVIIIPLSKYERIDMSIGIYLLNIFGFTTLYVILDAATIEYAASSVTVLGLLVTSWYYVRRWNSLHTVTKGL